MTGTPRGGGPPFGHHRGSSRGRGPLAERHPGSRATKIIAATVSALLLLGLGYGWWNYRDLNGNLNRLHVFTADTSTHHDIDGGDQNILLVGNDERTNMTAAEVRQLKVGRDGGSLNTDTMMIVHVPSDGKRATLISLPRDAYVEIPGYPMAKLNSAYSDAYTHTSGTTDQKRTAGMSLLIRTVQNLTGLRIDHFVQVSLIGFVRISDAVGGVTINLCHAVDDARYSHFVMSAGKHTIKGVTALEFVRQRHGLPVGDISREARQRYFLAAAFRKIVSAGTLLNPSRLHALISAIDRSVYVDGDFDIPTMAKKLSGLSVGDIHGDNIPYVRFDTVPGIGSVEIIDTAQVKQWVRDLLGTGTAELGTVKAAKPSIVTVRVLNGGTVNGAAGVNAKRLSGYGFSASVGNHGAMKATTVQYADGMQAQVKALLRYLPNTVVLQETDVPVLTLILGDDGLHVRAPGSGSSHPGTSSAASPPGTSPSPTGTSASSKSKPADSGCIN